MNFQEMFLRFAPVCSDTFQMLFLKIFSPHTRSYCLFSLPPTPSSPVSFPSVLSSLL